MRLQFNPVFRALVLVGLAAGVGCGTSPQSPAAPSPTAQSAQSETAVLASAGRGANVLVCHRTSGGDEFLRLSVPSSAVDPHLKHGDGLVGGAVPQHPGMTFDGTCTPVVSGTIVTFADLTDHGSLFTTYEESGVTVVSTQGEWQISTTFGHPAPFIFFESPEQAPTVTAAITVTAGGALFTFRSVEVYSSLTPIPYVFTGIRDSATVFTVSDTQPDTFGEFATVLNPYSGESIDTLVISLSNPAGVCCPNATGLDNIVIAN